MEYAYKNKYDLIIIYTVFSLVNFLLNINGNIPFTSIIFGQLFLFFLVNDFAKSKIQFHAYQIIIIYFYYQLIVVPNYYFLTDQYSFYWHGYVVNIVGAFLFIFGYEIKKTRYKEKIIYPKQKKIIFLFSFVVLVMSIYSVMENTQNIGYNERFYPNNYGRELPIYTMAIQSIVGHLKEFLWALLFNPIVYSVYNVFMSILGYIGSGVKASVLIAGVQFLLFYQIVYGKISIKKIILMLPVSIIFVTILVGTTAFRGSLNVQSLVNVLSDHELMSNSIKYFFVSPESSHVAYTSKIIEMIYYGQTDFRYGFDYFRFFLYPLKQYLGEFELASYNYYPYLISGERRNVGLYVGLSGELYWNFGIVFPIFMFIHGLILKKFTNYCFSGNYLRLLLYMVSLQIVIWHLYRGQGNAMIMTAVFILFGYMMANFFLKFNSYFLIKKLKIRV